MSDPNANKQGYKETRAGWIPEAWECNSLDSLVSLMSGGTPSMAEPAFWDGEIPWYCARDLKSFNLGRSSKYLTELGSLNGTRMAPPGTILILVRGMMLNRDFPVGVTQCDACFNQDIKALTAKADIANTRFVAYQLVQSRGRFLSQVDRSSHGTGKLQTEVIRSAPIPTPPLYEQKKIANILSTCDEAIEKIGELHAAKKRMQGALIHQLLTGKKRCPGFQRRNGTIATRTGKLPSDWKWIHLGEAFTKRTERSGNDLPLMAITIDSGMVSRDNIDRKFDSELTASDNLVARKGDIAYNTMRMWQGAVGLAEEDCHVSPAYVVGSPVAGVADSEFFIYWFKSAEGLHLLTSYSYGITGDRLRLYAADFAKVPAPLPPIEEQRAIVSVLRASEAEISQLEKKRAALQRQKRALMQKLLTGQVRVKV